MSENTKRLLLAVAVVLLVGIMSFGAGAVWQFQRKVVSSAALSNSTITTSGDTSLAGGATTANVSYTTDETQAAKNTKRASVPEVYINEKLLTSEQLLELQQTYRATVPPGRYWYDQRSGLYGYWGYEAAGLIRAGHKFGPLPENASNGNTGVFINGREINMIEAIYCQRLFGAVYQGRYWMDSSGYMGVEGNPTPLVNVFVAIQRASAQAGGGYRWRDGSGTVAGSEGNCTWMSVPGAPTYATSGCN